MKKLQILLVLILSVSFASVANAQTTTCDQNKFSVGVLMFIYDSDSTLASVQADTLGNGNCLTLNGGQYVRFDVQEQDVTYRDSSGCLVDTVTLTSSTFPNIATTPILINSATPTPITIVARRGLFCGGVVDSSCARTYTYDFCFATLSANMEPISAEEQENGMTRVSWATLNEKNTDVFQVRESSDGISWTPVGREVSAAGKAHNYSVEVWASKRYIQVLGKDKDGKSFLSNITEVSRAHVSLKVTSTHKRGTVLIQGAGLLRIFDQQGRTVLVQEVSSGPFNTGLSTGNYSAVLIKDDTKFASLVQIE